MPYLSRFYKKKRLPNLIRTDKMTGVLGDPFDPKPWLEINTTESQEDPQPKTLIFADPVYASRNWAFKSDIIEKLHEAKSAGFNILIMEPDQTLTVWDYSPLPTHYEAGYYSQETINYLAYTQHKLASEDILTLDYAGLNDLWNKSGRMDWSEFRDIPEDYFKIIDESKQHDLRLEISNNDFIKNLKERKTQELPQVKELKFEATPTEAEFETLFQHYQYIEKLHLGECSNIAGTLKKFPQQFKQLNFLSLNSSKLSSDELIQLLQATPSLSHLELRGCDIVLDEKVILPAIKNLKTFTVSGRDSSKTFSSILQAASSALEDIELRGNYDLSDFMTVLVSNKFPRLKNINMFENFYPTKENLAALFAAAPFLENLAIVKWPASGSWNLKPNQLPHLKNITLMKSKLSTHDLHALLNAAPQIEELNLARNNNLSGLNKFSFPSLNKLKKLNLESTSISADDLLTLLTSATNLEELNIQGCKKLSNVKKHLGDIQLPKLRTLQLSENLGVEDMSALLTRAPELTTLTVSNVANLFKGKNLTKLKSLTIVGELTRDDLTAIAAAAPNLENLNLDWCQYLPDENIWFGLEGVEFSKLKKITPPEVRNTIEVLDILETTPALVRIEYNNLREDLTEDVRPHQRKKLQDLGVIFSSDLPQSEFEKNTPPPPKEFSPSDFEEPKGPPPTFNCFEHFPGVHPSKYRLGVWRPNLDTLDRQPTFNPTDFKPAPLKQHPTKPFSRLQPGIREVTYAEGKDIILPSLETDEELEELFDLQIFDNKGRRVQPKGFSYSESTNFSRATLPAAGEYVIKYQLALSDPTKRPPLPPEIDALQRKYRPDDKVQQTLAADEKELPLIKPVKTLRDVIKNVRTNYENNRHHVVRCEERCYAAYEDLKKEYKENVRLSPNVCHAIIELKNGEYWYPLDLGGTAAHIQLTKPRFPQITDSKETKDVSQTVRYIPPMLFPMTDIPFTTAIQQTTPTLFVASDDSNIHELYMNLLKEYSAQDIFPVHKPDELSLTRQSMTHDGKIRPQNLFKEWLNEYIQNPNKKGIIGVDIRTLEEDALAQLNDLLDGKLENEQIPKNIRVVLVDKAVRGDYAADFRSRVPHKTIIPTPKEALLPEKTEEHETKDVVEIDLFQSPYWDRILLGSYKYKATDEADTFSLHWKKGQLFKAMDAKEIIFKNPPQNDPQFTTFVAELQSLRLLRWADQVTSFPPHIKFYQRNGYDWQRLSKGASLHPIKFEGDKAAPLVLSNTNILSFIENPAIHFSKTTGQLTKTSSHLKHREEKTIDVICTPDLSAGTLAQFLTEAQKRNVHVNFHTPNPNALPDSSPLKFLFKSDRALESKEKFTPSKNPQVNFHISDDVEFTAMLLAEKKRDTIKLDISALDNSELGRIPAFDEKAKAYLKAEAKLKMGSTLADIVTHLRADKNVILYGDIPNTIYENLTALTLGEFEGQRFSGTLTIITSPQKANVVSALTGQTPPTHSPPLSEKIAALEKRYPGAVDNFDFSDAKSDMTYATLERNLLNHQLISNRSSLTGESKTPLTDEQLSDRFDQARLQDTLLALHLNPWGMIAGATGIGKSHFLNEILPKHIKTVYSLEEWLTAKPPKGQKLALIMDEASFLSQLSGEGPNLLERFKSLKNKPPGFMWKGHYHILTDEHKALFSFNPASYGAGRSTQGFLTEQALSIPFQRLPDFYIRARLTTPLFKEVLSDIYLPELPKITAPLIDVFRWINNEYQKENLITAREIRLMINIIASQLHRKLPTKLDVDTVVNLAKEAANFVGRQTLGEESELLERFDKNFSLSSHVLGDRSAPEKLALHLMTNARQFLLERKSTQTITDVGLGGIVLEGPESICKSTIEEWMDKHIKPTGQKIYRISSNVPYLEKEKLLRAAFDEGALVIAIGLNSSDWPNRILNNFLMGVDEKNQKAKKPGFLLFGTQRPPSEPGCHPEDPALRRRLIKLNVDRAPYQKTVLVETPEALKTRGLFAVTAAASAGDAKTPRPERP